MFGNAGNLFSKAPYTSIGNKLSLGNIVGGINKSLGVVNQAIPLYQKAKPLFRNANSIFNTIKTFSTKNNPKDIITKNNNIKKDQQIINTTGPTFFL